MHAREALHPITIEDGKIFPLAVCYTMSDRENDVFCKGLLGLKLRDDAHLTSPVVLMFTSISYHNGSLTIVIY